MPEDHNPVSRAMTKASIALAAVKQIRNWPVYFLDYAGLMKDNRVVYIFNSGTKISTRLGTSDRNIINEVWLTDVYQPKGFEIKKGDIVLDIGAHIGTFSLLASLVADAVYAYEPAPENFEVLQQNITMNRAKNIIAMRAAVAGVAGSRELFLRANDPCMHSMYFKSPLTTKITATSLEEIVTKNNIDHIDYLKLDCEGAEFEILSNCPSHILKKIKKMAVECHYLDQEHTQDSMEAFLKNKGFLVTISPGHNRILYATQAV